MSAAVFMVAAVRIFDEAEDMDAGIMSAPHDGFIHRDEVYNQHSKYLKFRLCT